MKAKYKNSPTWVKFFQWLGVMALLTIVAMSIWLAIPGDHNSTPALKWFQFVQTIGTFLLPPIVCMWLWGEEFPKLRIQSSNGFRGWVYLYAVGLMVIAMPGINLLADWNSRIVLPDSLAGLEAWMKEQEQALAVLTERFLSGTDLGTLLVNIGLIALLPALAEELTFRGVLQGLIAKPTLSTASNSQKTHIAVWVAAFIFSAIHMQFYGFIPRLLLGALFGYALLWTGTLWIPIIMHFTNNLIAVITYWWMYRRGLDPNSINSLGTAETEWLGWVSILLTAVGIYFFWRRSRQISSASSRMSDGN